MQYYVALCSSLKLLSLESILRIQQQKYDIRCTCTNPHYIDFLTSNFWRVDFGNLFLLYDVQKRKKKQGKKHHSPHGGQYYLFKIADIKRASDPRIWCVLIVEDYQILPGYNKWGIRRERNETLVHIPYVHWFVVQSVCSQNVV